jgi:tRNA nucleotidyltransferase (CCA-adding enzyme)
MARLDADLRRRDFTINAMAMSLQGVCIDPLGGAGDLQSRLLRPCSDDAFSADPLRIFRAFRFEAAGWQLTSEAVALIRARDWSAALRTMPQERFSNELIKALAQKAPERFFLRMIECAVGGEFLPELFQMPAIPAGPLVHHPEGDLLTHSIQVLQRVAAATDDPLARYCALFHDIGKLATDPARYPKHHGHDAAGFALAEQLGARLCLPVVFRKALAWVSSLHGKANLWDQLRDATKLKMADQANKAGVVTILPLVAAADKPGGVPIPGWETVVRIARMTTAELGIDREMLEAMAPAKRPAFLLQKRVEALRGER